MFLTVHLFEAYVKSVVVWCGTEVYQVYIIGGGGETGTHFPLYMGLLDDHRLYQVP